MNYCQRKYEYHNIKLYNSNFQFIKYYNMNFRFNITLIINLILLTKLPV